MSILLAGTITITAPSASDGFGQVAVLNNTGDATNFVGTLWKTSGLGGPNVRTSIEELPEAHGAAFGSFFHGPRSFTLEVAMRPGANWAASDARYVKLCRAWNAMAANGTIVWTDTDAIAKRISFRREQPPTDADETGRVLLAGVMADPRIVANSESSSAPGAGLSNAGDVGASPRIEFTSAASGSVVLSRTSPGSTQSVTLTIGGTAGLAASTATVVDFGAWPYPTVMQGSTNKYSAVSFPSSTWWEMAPGSNTVAVTGATSVTVYWRSSWLAA